MDLIMFHIIIKQILKEECQTITGCSKECLQVEVRVITIILYII
jgi:hypothetical protein